MNNFKLETDLTMDTLVDFKLKGAVNRVKLSDIYDEEQYGDHEDFYKMVTAWVQVGMAKIVDLKTEDEKMADKVIKELHTMESARNFEEDHNQRLNYGAESKGVYAKVSFPAKTMLDAQELAQAFMRNFNITKDQIGIEGGLDSIEITIKNCPVKTYNSINRAYGLRRGAEFVGNTIEKTAKGIVNTTDMAINSLATPVAKTAIGTTTKVAKTLIGFTAKIAGMTVGQTVKATKECIQEVKSDGYINEAKAEVMDSIHQIKRTMGNSSFGSNMGGKIIE